MSNATQTKTTHGGLLMIHALTSLHPGSGTALGTVDLPVQRERHTGWPTIAGSALKGILRDAYREMRKANHGNDRKTANEKDSELVAIFGPGAPEDSSAHAGALTVTDARILAFPVRSLRGVFAWVTCQAVLERLCRDLQLVGMAYPQLPKAWPGKNQALVTNESSLMVQHDNKAKIVLEEFDFDIAGRCDEVANWLSSHASDGDNYSADRLKTHLAILHDDDFTYFVRHATEIVARIALDYERKTVKQGALFYQEFLPAETLMYSLLLANDSRKKNQNQSTGNESENQTTRKEEEKLLPAGQILELVGKCLSERGILQIGGDETTGKGLCRVFVVR